MATHSRELQGQRSLANHSAWGHKECDMTDTLTFFPDIWTRSWYQNASNTRCNNALLPQKKRTKAAPVFMSVSSVASRPSQRPVQQSWPLHTLVLPQKGLVPSHRREIAVGWPGAIRHRYSSRTKEYTLSLKQGKIIPQAEKFRTSCKGSLFLRKCSRPMAQFLGSWVGVKADTHEPAFFQTWRFKTSLYLLHTLLLVLN